MGQVFSANNVHIVAAPPSYYLPSAAGAAVPLSGITADLAVDLGGAIPAGQTFGIVVERQVAGVWSDDASAEMTTGPYSIKGGPSTTVNHLAFEIRASDDDGNPVGPYPARWRVRVDQAGVWTLPTVTLTTSP